MMNAQYMVKQVNMNDEVDENVRSGEIIQMIVCDPKNKVMALASSDCLESASWKEERDGHMLYRCAS